jgi:uncharacterized membrane protein YhaH (DUF805 family)
MELATEIFLYSGHDAFYFVAALQCILAVFAIRRARDAGIPAFWGLAIFLPYYLGLLALIGLTLLPSQEDAEAGPNAGADGAAS